MNRNVKTENRRRTVALPKRRVAIAAPAFRRRRRLAPLPLRAAFTLVFAFAQAACLAAEPAAARPAPLIALHYQDILAHEPPTVDLLIPPPPNTVWDSVSYSTTSPCLEAGELYAGEPNQVLIVTLNVPEVGNCSSRVEFTFEGEGETWRAAAIVVANRLPPLAELEDVKPNFISSSLPVGSGSPVPMLILNLTNPTSETLTVRGIGNDEDFASMIGRAFHFDSDRPTSSYAALKKQENPFGESTIGPGETVGVALVIDPDKRLSGAAGAITVRPIGIVEIGGQLRTVDFPHISSAWGADLP